MVAASRGGRDDQCRNRRSGQHCSPLDLHRPLLLVASTLTHLFTVGGVCRACASGKGVTQGSVRTLCAWTPTRSEAGCCWRRAARWSSSSTRATSVIGASRRARQSVDGLARGRAASRWAALGRGGDRAARRSLRRRRPTRAARLSQPDGRSHRVRGAARRLHGGGVARAPHPARATALAARDRHPSRRGRPRPRRSGPAGRSSRSRS